MSENVTDQTSSCTSDIMEETFQKIAIDIVGTYEGSGHRKCGRQIVEDVCDGWHPR